MTSPSRASAVAVFDALFLIDRITAVTASRTGDPEPGAADLEVQSLAYFSNILQNWSSEDPWGYEFFVTKDSEPFATMLANALRTLKARGAVEDLGLLNRLSHSGHRVLRNMTDTNVFLARRVYLDVAVSTARFLTIPLVVRSIGHEPTLRSSKTSRPLLDDAALAVLSEYLDAAKAMMDPNFNLNAVAEVILNYFLVAEDGRSV